MNDPEPISPELQEKIDALTDDALRRDLIFLLSRPVKRSVTNEEIFRVRVESYQNAMAQRALLHDWQDDEVSDFVGFFRREMPEEYLEFLKQERERNEIDENLSSKVHQLAMRWMPGLDFSDYSFLSGKVRDHARLIIAKDEV
jgi:hypothetical protein